MGHKAVKGTQIEGGTRQEKVVIQAVVPFIIGTIHTCNIFDIKIIVVMSEIQVRSMCRCITWNVFISQLSLVEARVTHVSANNEHGTPPEASLAHAKIYFLINLWRGIAKALNVKCSKLNDGEKEMHK